MRQIIFKQMQDGKTDAQIKQYLVDRYSDYVLYDPPLKPSTWLLWFGPAADPAAGCRRRAGHGAQAHPHHAAETAAASRPRGLVMPVRTFLARSQEADVVKIAFILVALLMMLAALALVVLPMLRRGRRHGRPRHVLVLSLLVRVRAAAGARSACTCTSARPRP